MNTGDGNKTETLKLPRNIEKRIESLVTAEVQKQIDRERAILQDVGGVALKIIGVALFMLFGIFTVFGLTTWKDVKEQTADFMRKRVDELIQKGDAETGVKRTLNDLVNRAIVSSVLVSSRPGSDDDEEKNIELAKYQWDRLRAWLKLEDLGIQEFKDTLAILNAQSEERKKADANNFLAKMLYPPAGSPFEWIKEQPDKREAIMSNFMHRDMGLSAIEVAQAQNASQDMRVAAARYVRSIGYSEGVDKLLDLVAKSDGELKREALISCASLRPTHPRVVVEIEKLFSQQAGTDEFLAAADLFRELPAGGRSDADAEKISALRKRLLGFVADHASYFTLLYTVREGRSSADDEPSVTTRFSVRIAGERVSRRVFQGPESAFIELKPYWQLLKEAADGGDLKKLTALIFRRAGPGGGPPAVRLALSPQSKLTVKTEAGELKELTSSQLRQVLMKRVTEPSVTVEWTVGDGSKSSGTLTQLSGGGFEFSLIERSALTHPSG